LSRIDDCKRREHDLMSADKMSLTGVWHGLYSYAAFREPVYFVATLIDGGSFISGSTHEQEVGETGAPLTLYASIEGVRAANAVAFNKTYDGSGGWEHAVSYSGALNADCSEIEGEWRIDIRAAGRFLMIRNRGVEEKAVRRAFAKV
jgi:hypothetical protein